LDKGGFDGAVYPVNPRYEELFGRRCYASIADVPEPVDLAVISLANALLEDALRQCVATGAGSAVIYASGFEEPREGVPSLTERLASIAREAGMAICGGNCMGFVNVERGLRATGWEEPERLEPGGITFVSHSGSAFAAYMHNDRDLRFNLVVSSGQEFVTTTSDYMRYALGLESTRAMGLFIETIRDPEGFREAMRIANERDVPVVVLKVGREAFTREMQYLANLCHATPVAPGNSPVRLPGEGALARRRRQIREGVALHEGTLPALVPWAERFGVAMVAPRAI